jgi:hypothetical protein
MRCLVSAGIYRARGALLKTMETVVGEKPLLLATSRMVTVAAEKAFADLSRGLSAFLLRE